MRIDWLKEKIHSLIPGQANDALVDVPPEHVLQAYQQGAVPCSGCETAYELDSLAPLSLFNCESCGELIFVPWAIGDLWAVSPMAAGGFGSVYLSVDMASGQLFALKLLQRSEHIDENDVAAFLRECEVSHAFGEHPHLVATHAYGEAGGAAYMVMDLVKGDRFDELVEAQHGLAPELLLYYVLDIVSALEHILAHGYIHRDVKPDNILIKEDGLAVLTDYGSCLSLETALELESGPVVSSPHFCAPERYDGAPEDVRSDMYSLGHVIYYGLTGNVYSRARDVKGVTLSHTSRVRLPLSSKLKGQNPDLIAMIEAMIRRDPNNRIDSYDLVRRQIEELLPVFQQAKTTDKDILNRRRLFQA